MGQTDLLGIIFQSIYLSTRCVAGAPSILQSISAYAKVRWGKLTKRAISKNSEMHALEMYAHEIHAYQSHAHEVYTHESHA
jgi:hypothetical protein